MRTVELAAGATPRAWGHGHGESFRGEIQSLAELRTYLTVRVGGFADAEAVLEVAAAHVPVLEQYDRDLYDEFCGIAEGAGVSPAALVVLNHYTDLRDIAGSSPSPEAAGGCSILWARTPAGPVLAQTWDMHATAIPYVAAVHVPARGDQPESWLLGLTGCLGMAGVNALGVGVAINNLHSTDARVGIVWPALVRRALRATTAEAARDVILAAPIGSGHHYLVADAGSAYGIETSGTRSKVMFTSTTGDHPASYVHTNHCVDPEIHRWSRVPDGSTTHDRYHQLARSLAERPIVDVDDAWARLGSHDGYPRSVCTNMATPEHPHRAATCGAIAALLGPGGADVVLAQAGFIHNVAPERFAFAAPPGSRAEGAP